VHKQTIISKLAQLLANDVQFNFIQDPANERSAQSLPPLKNPPKVGTLGLGLAQTKKDSNYHANRVCCCGMQKLDWRSSYGRPNNAP